MNRTPLLVLAVARTILVAMTAFTLVIAVRVLGGDLPAGHPPVAQGEECPVLPPGHPPVDDELLPGLPPGHPPVRVQRLPPGHPPVDDARPVLPLLEQGGTSTI
ncbi:MAG TPA: hypothetical protein VFM45_07150 [Anaeromyxobacteraceae bacterium]|nr:hypothetical protein [Anaeromyxobacteraceae bacterium]